jgi:hypothetical protein
MGSRFASSARLVVAEAVEEVGLRRRFGVRLWKKWTFSVLV